MTIEWLGIIVAACTVAFAAGYGWREVFEWNERRETALRGTAGPEYSTRPYPYHVVEFPGATTSTALHLVERKNAK